VLEAADTVTQAAAEAAARELWALACGRQTLRAAAQSAAQSAADPPAAPQPAAAAQPPAAVTEWSPATLSGALASTAVSATSGTVSGLVDTSGAAAVPGSELAAVEADLFTKQPEGGGGGMPIVLPRDITEYAFSEDEVYVVGTNGRKVTVIAGLEHLSATLETLVLRSHVISRMEGLSTLVRCSVVPAARHRASCARVAGVARACKARAGTQGSPPL